MPKGLEKESVNAFAAGRGEWSKAVESVQIKREDRTYFACFSYLNVSLYEDISKDRGMYCGGMDEL